LYQVDGQLNKKTKIGNLKMETKQIRQLTPMERAGLISIGITSEMLDKTVDDSAGTFKIVGYDPKRSRTPIELVDIHTGKIFRSDKITTYHMFK
jgi:hypothetical protein